jgi:hypothetical protein
MGQNGKRGYSRKSRRFIKRRDAKSPSREKAINMHEEAG